MRLPLTALALSLAAVGAHAEAPFSFAATPGKLPKDVVPIQYTAHLVPDVANNTFSGSETIEIEVKKATSTIMLNALNMEIDAASLNGKSLAETALTPVFDKEAQTLSFKLAKPLAPGKYTLALNFRGVVNREPRGLFYLKYKNGADDKSLLATTMEPTDARRLLPTWDEPAFRAKFKLTVDVPASFKAYSNTPAEKQETLPNGLQRVSFAVTPKMPSYLFVLVAGEMARNVATQDGVELGVVSTIGKEDSTQFALDASKDLLRYYNNYFGQPYPLAKLDQIAIPGMNGAMENWGGIVYNEGALLYNPKRNPDSTKQVVYAVAAHEIAHQWFGNLVTMAWWDNLWLNEGFASWMGTKATAHFHPEWRVQLEAMVDREGVMNLDARATTHPIQTKVENEEQANSVFDAITYGKGQAFLHMLEAYLGEDAFRKGIQAYMAQHKYSNTTTADLWAALEKASGKPVAKLASAWTTQAGVPVVKVAQRCENGQRKITLSQQPFVLDGSPVPKRQWPIPVALGTVGGKAEYTVLTGASSTVTRPGCDGQLIVDPDSVGYYRVQYDDASFNALAAIATKLPDASRVKLLGDAWAMVASERIPLSRYLALASQFKDEPRLAVWGAMLRNLGNLYQLAEGTPERAKLGQYIAALVMPKFQSLGWEEKQGESVEDRQLRTALAGVLARTGDQKVIAEARARFQRYLADPASLPPSSLNFVMSVVGRYADEATYEALKGLALKAQSLEERNRFARSLTMALDPKLSERTLQIALSPDLPIQLTSMMVPGVASAEHIDQAWAFAVANREALLKNEDSVAGNRLYPAIVASSANAADADKMEAYVKQHFSADALVDAKRIGNGVRVRAKQKALLVAQIGPALDGLK
ncbi:M1 family metallopeptidase [Massilia sp. SR12]